MSEVVASPSSRQTPPLASEARSDIPEFVRTGDRLMIIGGERLPAVSGQTLQSVDPVTEETLATIPRGDAEDIDLAVRAAQKAFDDLSWSDITPDLRTKYLLQIAAVFEQHAEELSKIDSINMGGPNIIMRQMAETAAEGFRYYAGIPGRLAGQNIPAPSNRLIYTRKQPLGVVGLIWGWNGPLGQLPLKLGPALATGNTVILKPPEVASLSTLRLAELILKHTDLPAGVINVVTGTGQEAGEALVKHPGVAKIGFTGSTKTGRRIQEMASATLKRVTLELGGKSPTIVCADADLDAAVLGAARGFCGHAGQVCVAGTRVFVHESIREEFAERLAGAIDKAFTPGDPFTPRTFIGPLASKQQFDRVMSYINLATEEGATIRTGGKRYGDHGYFVEPTLLENVTADMRVVKEEIFGPVGALMSFSDLDDVIAKANATEYGLAASVWTQDLSTAHRLANKLAVGTVWVNTWGEMTTGQAPFGGFKQSGVGREGGLDVVDAYTETKTVWMAI
jgi:aldehyde dehydrogenase (NAD+)